MITTITERPALRRGQKPIRAIRIEGEVAYVPLTKGYEAVIDAADVHLIEGRNWSADVQVRGGRIWNVYAVALVDGKPTRMHRHITSAQAEAEVDHDDGNGLNNRRSSNLRIASHAENQRNMRTPITNKSGLKGVSWSARDRRWRAQIQVAGENIGLGNFLTKEAAYAAYVAASKKHHGKFGRTA